MYIYIGFPGSSAGNKSTCNAGDPSSIPGLGQSTGEGTGYPFQYSWASLVVQRVKNLPALRETWFDPWIGKIPWRRAWQPTPVFLPEESPQTEKPGGLQSMGSQRVRYDSAIKQHTHTQYIFYNSHAILIGVRWYNSLWFWSALHWQLVMLNISRQLLAIGMSSVVMKVKWNSCAQRVEFTYAMMKSVSLF